MEITEYNKGLSIKVLVDVFIMFVVIDPLKIVRGSYFAASGIVQGGI